jgi:hypothetical protein
VRKYGSLLIMMPTIFSAVLFPIFTISGISYGMIELIRRVIPRDIVGGDAMRLKKMDALIHVLYEIAGTIAAFTSSMLIEALGYNYSSFLSPILFGTSALAWWFLDIYGPSSGDSFLDERVEWSGQRASPTIALDASPRGSRIFAGWWVALRSFGKAFYYGGWLCLTSRKFVWLIPGGCIGRRGKEQDRERIS